LRKKQMNNLEGNSALEPSSLGLFLFFTLLLTAACFLMWVKNTFFLPYLFF